MEKKSPGCVYCGAAPTPHALAWLETAISLFFDRPLRISMKPLVILFTPFVRWLTNTGIHLTVSLFALLGLMSFSSDVIDGPRSRKSVVVAEARRRGIRLERMFFRGKEISYARAWLPLVSFLPLSGWQYFEHIPIPPWKDSPLWQNLDNKLELKELFSRHDIRVPHGKAHASLRSALRTFKSLGAPCIVKPLEGSRARHTRVRVTKEADFIDAFRRAQQLCPLVLVEEFVEGDVHRVTCIDGVLVAVMRFVRPSIVADGIHTAEELRKRYNAGLSFDGVSSVNADALFEVTLAHQNLTPDMVPSQGTSVRLADFSERVNGGYNEDMTDAISPARRAYFEKAARLSRLAVVGFDVISHDLTNDDEEAVFLEANTAPFIEIHEEPTIGRARNVAGPVFDLWTSADTASKTKGRA